MKETEVILFTNTKRISMANKLPDKMNTNGDYQSEKNQVSLSVTDIRAVNLTTNQNRHRKFQRF